MELKEFPNCCGAGIIIDLYYNSQIEEQLKAHILEAKANTWGILLGITNEEQSTTAAIMKKLGFRSLFEFNNPGKESWLILWMIDLEKVDAFKLKEPVTLQTTNPALQTTTPFTTDTPVQIHPDWSLLKSYFEGYQ